MNLAKSLGIASLAVAEPGSIIPILEQVCFADGKLKTFDGRVYMECDVQLPLGNGNSFTGCVPASGLRSVLLNYDSDTLRLELRGKALSVRDTEGALMLRVPVTPAREFPYTDAIADGFVPIRDLDCPLADILRNCALSIESAHSNPTYSGIFVYQDLGSYTFAASNGVSLSFFSYPRTHRRGRRLFFIPYAALRIARALASAGLQPPVLQVDKRVQEFPSVLFSTEGVRFVTIPITGIYDPNFRPYFDQCHALVESVELICNPEDAQRLRNIAQAVVTRRNVKAQYLDIIPSDGCSVLVRIAGAYADLSERLACVNQLERPVQVPFQSFTSALLKFESIVFTQEFVVFIRDSDLGLVFYLLPYTPT